MAGYTLTFDPANGSTVTLAEGEGLSSFTISCEDGIALNSNRTWILRDVDGADSRALNDFYPNEDGTALVGRLASAITEPGTYYLGYTNHGNFYSTIPEGTFLLGPADAQVESEEMEYYFTVVIFNGLILPLTDLDGYVTGSAYVTPAEGSGDGAVSVTADEGNEGLDRSGVVTFSTTKGEPTISVARTIVQEGLREPFAGSDGDFIVADGGTFHVLK